MTDAGIYPPMNSARNAAQPKKIFAFGLAAGFSAAGFFRWMSSRIRGSSSAAPRSSSVALTTGRVVGLQDHHFLVAAERLFDVRHAAVQAGLHVALLFLQRVGPHIERQHQKVHDQAQHNDGQAGVADHAVGVDIDDLKQKLQRLKQQRIQYLNKCHGSFSSCVAAAAVSSRTFCSR